MQKKTEITKNNPSLTFKRGLGRLDYHSFGRNDPETRMIKIDLKLMTKEQLVSNVEDESERLPRF